MMATFKELADAVKCSACSKRQRLNAPERVAEAIIPKDALVVTGIQGCEDELSNRKGVRFEDLSEDAHEATLLCLWGNQAAAAITAASPFYKDLMGVGKLWKQFVAQEFPTRPEQHSGTFSDLYRVLYERQRCKELKWKRVPCQHNMGSREGSPGMFARHGYLFVFGGWGHGPLNDLHVGKLALPMKLNTVRVSGRGPQHSYEAKTTVLDDDSGVPGRLAESSEEEGVEDNASTELVIRTIITGGYRYGGYHGESDHYGVLEIRLIPATGSVHADWVHKGEMPEGRSNHSATFIPPRVAGPSFPSGYLLVFGGNVDGEVTNTLDVLDLSTFQWSIADLSPHGDDQPAPRNSHSATLLQVPFLGDAVLIVGGGTGCDGNGGPPRGGRDVTDSWWLSGLENAGPFKWSRAPEGEGNPIAAGRGHVACRLDGTGTVLTVGGGLPPRNMCVAFDLAKGGLTYGGECHKVHMASDAKPKPRAFGGGCALPGGSVLIYGGWDPRGGTYADLWIGHADALETELFKQIPDTAVAEVEPLPRWFGGTALSRELLDFRRRTFLDDEVSDEEESPVHALRWATRNAQPDARTPHSDTENEDAESERETLEDSSSNGDSDQNEASTEDEVQAEDALDAIAARWDM